MEIGKKIGTFTARGQITEEFVRAGKPKRVRLFDGRFDTAYRVTGFWVWPYGTRVAYSDLEDVAGKLATNDQASFLAASFFDASNANEIAWAEGAGTRISLVADFGQGSFILDRDNLIIEDLFVYALTAPDTTPMNYLIEMDKYEISEGIGAVTMARDKAAESGYVV